MNQAGQIPFFAEGGVAGELIRSIDWSESELGPVSTWPRSLVGTVGLVLRSRHPMFLFWGEGLVQFYNDAYAPSFGRGKHPKAMGQRGHECWQEIWPIIFPQIDDVMKRGKASWNEDALVPIFRNGRLEEVYWTYGYSPVLDDDGKVGGTLVVCTETTSRVVASRRADLVRRLADKLVACKDMDEVLSACREWSEGAKHDVPCILTYRRTVGSGKWRRTGEAGVLAASTSKVDRTLAEHIENPAPVGRRTPTTVPVTIPTAGSPWPEVVSEAVVLASSHWPSDKLVLGISPRLPFDAPYIEFLGHVGEQVDHAALRIEAMRTQVAAERERDVLLKKLEAASHAKDDFLATVSHELRTPLNAILGWSKLLGETQDSARLQKGLGVIEKNARAQAQLINDILDVSRIIAGKVRMSIRSIDLARVIHEATETARPSAVAKQVTLIESFEPGLGKITADEDRLQQIVWNLLSNAVKFTGQGGQVVVSAKRTDDVVTISVRDTGRGISPQFLPHVFDRFRQDDSSTTKSQAGLGLGLSIVRHLVELHGGTVSASSAGPNEGSTFEFVLPIHASDPREDTMPPRNDAQPDRNAAPPSTKPLADIHVLVVDDQEDARDLVAMVLEDAGARVTQAESAAAAMQVLEQASISVIVSDVGMPGEDGYTFIRRVRESGLSPRVRGVPALALTAFARAEDRDRALAAGFQEHVAKPVDLRKLVGVVSSLARR